VEDIKLSREAHRRLSEELAERSGPTRRQISELIERARELGDLKENGDYHAAKNEQGLNEARIRQLDATLKAAVVVESTSADKVEAGTLVEVRMEGDDETSTYLIGSIEERGTGYDVISPGSPLGKALLGHAPGETGPLLVLGTLFTLQIALLNSASPLTSPRPPA